MQQAMAGVTLLAVLVASLVLGCGGDDAASTQTTEPAVAADAATEAPTSSPTDDGAAAEAAWKNAVAFAEAMSQTKPDFSAASTFVSPGSPAARYVEHQSNLAAAIVAAGLPEGQDSFSVVPDKTAQSITVSASSPGAETYSYTWTDFQYDDQGLVASWTGDSGPLAEVLWTESTTGSGGGATVTVKSAYRANLGSMYIVLEVAAGQGALMPDYTAGYVGPDGVVRQPAFVAQPSEIPAGAKANMVYEYEDAGFGGSLTYNVISADSFEQTSVQLPIR